MVYMLYCTWCICSTVHGVYALLYMVYMLYCTWCICSTVHGVHALLYMVYMLYCTWCTCSPIFRRMVVSLCVVVQWMPSSLMLPPPLMLVRVPSSVPLVPMCALWCQCVPYGANVCPMVPMCPSAIVTLLPLSLQ